MILLTPALWLILKRRKYYWPEPALLLLILIGLGRVPAMSGNINIYYILGAYLGMNFKELADRRNYKLSVVAALCLPVMVVWGAADMRDIYCILVFFLLRYGWQWTCFVSNKMSNGG